MKTEINGDWKGYFTRFKMPSSKALVSPLKYFGICFAAQIVFCGVAALTHVLILVMSSMIIGAVLYAACKYFWEVMLEEAKGFWADFLMWVYYAFLLLITVVLPLVITWPYLV